MILRLPISRRGFTNHRVNCQAFLALLPCLPSEGTHADESQADQEKA